MISPETSVFEKAKRLVNATMRWFTMFFEKKKFKGIQNFLCNIFERIEYHSQI